MGFTLRAGDPLGKALQAFQLTTSIADAADEREKKKALGEVESNIDADSMQSTDIAPDGKETTKFRVGGIYGKEYGGRDDAILAAQQGIYRKFGDTEGATRVGRDAQQAKLAGIQIAGAERQARRDEASDKKAKGIEDIDADVAKWTKNRLTDGNGQPRDMSAEDQLAIGHYRAAKLFEGGHVAEASAMAKDNMSMAANQIQLQTAERGNAHKLAASAAATGDYGPMRAFYDKFVPDGARVVDVKTGKNGEITIERETTDGRKLPPHPFKNHDELMAGFNTLNDPMALYNYSTNEFKKNLELRKVKADEKRADAAMIESNARAAAAGVKAEKGSTAPEEAKKEAEYTQSVAALLKTQQSAGKDALTSFDPKTTARMEDEQRIAQRLAAANYKAGTRANPGDIVLAATELARAGHSRLPVVSTEEEVSRLKPGEKFITPGGTIATVPIKK
jgi:hypothetical protein